MGITTVDMYSGMTSGSFGTNKAVKQQRKDIDQAKNEIKTAILPAYEKLIDDINAEIEDKSNITSFMTGAYATDDEVRFELAARRRYIDLLKNLKMKYTSIVKGKS